MWKNLFGRGAPRGDDAPAPDPGELARRALVAYHLRTSHAPFRFAAGPPALDWENQPDPFRRWEGAPVRALQRFAQGTAEAGAEAGPAGSSPPLHGDVVAGRLPPAAPLDASGVARFLWDAFSLSAAKRYGTTQWFLRVPPSSGNLHPGEVHVVLPAGVFAGEPAAVWHYDPRGHALARRGLLAEDAAAALFGGAPEGPFFVALSAIAWREAWKYGERAFRYVQHDTGHLLGCLDFAAAASGLSARMLERFGHDALTRLLGLEAESGVEAERAQVLVAVHPAGSPAPDPDPSAFAAAGDTRWSGRASPLSPDHVEWAAVDVAEEASRAPIGGVSDSRSTFADDGESRESPEPGGVPLRSLLRRRRSAQAFVRAEQDRASWFRGLVRLTPGRGVRPFALWPHRPRVHAALFVHAVADVAPGVYLLARGPGALERIRGAFTAPTALGPPRFEPVEDAPAGLALVELARGDVRSLAAELACGQGFVADAVWSVVWLAEFEDAFAALGPAAYRRIHWEAGLVGQALYIEAEAAGFSMTGIGCFFDGETQRALGLVGHALVGVYHSAIGRATVDARIVTSAPYG